MAYQLVTPRIGAQKIAETSTTARHPLGTCVVAHDPDLGEGEFIYLLGVANTLVGSTVTYSPSSFQTALSPNTASTGHPIAVAMSANVASQYGWYQIGGTATVKKTAVAVSPNVAVYQSATTGRIMPTVASGKQIVGARSANLASVTSTTSNVLVRLNRPHIQGRVGVA